MNNELMDVKSINIPDLSKIDNKEWYIYACSLKPGYHKLLIYDPLLDKAYCKDHIASLN